METIDINSFKDALKHGATIFDTRPKPLFERDGLTGVDHLPLEQAQAGDLPNVSEDEAIYLICERGQVSELVGLYLEAAGFTQVFNVAGGMIAWRQTKLDAALQTDSVPE